MSGKTVKDNARPEALPPGPAQPPAKGGRAVMSSLRSIAAGVAAALTRSVKPLAARVRWLLEVLQRFRKRAERMFLLIGVVSGLIEAVERFVKLAAWLVQIIAWWRAATHWIWSTALWFLRVDIPIFVSSMLTSIVFVLLLGITSSRWWGDIPDPSLEALDEDAPRAAYRESSHVPAFAIYMFILGTLLVLFVGHLREFQDLQLGFLSYVAVAIVFLLTANTTVIISDKRTLLTKLIGAWALFALILAANFAYIYREEILAFTRG